VPPHASPSSWRWVNPRWWRDWLFWAALVVATTVLLVQLRRGDLPWGRGVWAWTTSAVLTVAVLGFCREVVRGYRGTDRPDGDESTP
jgi:hypothetical protein